MLTDRVGQRARIRLAAIPNSLCARRAHFVVRRQGGVGRHIERISACLRYDTAQHSTAQHSTAPAMIGRMRLE